MRIDVHNHIGVDMGFYLRGWWPYAGTAQTLLQNMDLSRIDRAVVFPLVVASAYDPYAFASHGRIELLSGRFPYDRENQLLITECQRIDLDHRLRVLAMFDPHRHVDQQLAALEKIVGKITGLKTQTTVTQAPITDLLGPGGGIMDFAQRHDLPVLFHTAVHPEDPWAQVRDCLKVAQAYPKVRFNLAHSLRFDREHLKEAAAMPNVWVDCAAHLAHCRLAVDNSPSIAAKDRRVDADYTNPTDALRAVHALLGERYLWGSDSPFMSWCDDDARIVQTYQDEVAVIDALPAMVVDDLCDRGPRAWLGGRLDVMP